MPNVGIKTIGESVLGCCAVLGTLGCFFSVFFRIAVALDPNRPLARTNPATHWQRKRKTRPAPSAVVLAGTGHSRFQNRPLWLDATIPRNQKNDSPWILAGAR